MATLRQKITAAVESWRLIDWLLFLFSRFKHEVSDGYTTQSIQADKYPSASSLKRLKKQFAAVFRIRNHHDMMIRIRFPKTKPNHGKWEYYTVWKLKFLKLCNQVSFQNNIPEFYFHLEFSGNKGRVNGNKIGFKIDKIGLKIDKI